MWPHHPDLLARNVPRYTSYPTAADFRVETSHDFAAEPLALIGADTGFSLYLHIPYCKDICWYCGCNTGRANRADRLTAYLDGLHAEIATVARLVEGRGRLNFIAFGGGSPNAISPVAFARLIADILVAFRAERPGISVEIDPRSFGRGWALTLGSTGVHRVSLGVQTFDPDIQAAIGRVQPRQMIVDAVDRLRANRVRSINFDLMYGLPGQTLDRLDATIDATLALAPERIALFGYAHMPNLLVRQRRIDASHLPDGEERFRMAAHGHRRFVEAGYIAIGFDHFALPGDPLAIAATEGRLRRNFQGFTDESSDHLIGIGASAISSHPDRIVQNEKAAARWRMRVTADRLAPVRGIRRSDADRARARIIEDLLCGRTAELAALGGEAYDALVPFIDRGLARLDGTRLTVTDAGLPYARAIAACFDQYRQSPVGQFSRAI